MKTFHETQLAWPQGRAKTPADQRKKGQFKTSLSNALSRVEFAVSAFTAPRNNWRTSRLTIFMDGGELGVNGWFLSRSTFRSPAVSVEFDLDGKTYRMATDKLTDPAQALCGIAVAIEGVRAQERYGIFTPAEMLQSFEALPPPKDPFADCKSLASVTATYRNLAKAAHPDHGGSHDAMSTLNSQRDRAVERLA